MDRRDFIKYGLILAGAGGVCCYAFKKAGKDFKFVKTDADKILNYRKPCGTPFEYIEIFDNDLKLYPCRYNNFYKQYDFGNLLKNNFQDVWNGKQFNELRQKLLNNDYSMCNLETCEYYTPSDYTKDFDASKQGPKLAFLSYDWECNYKCITCRDEIITDSDEILEFLNKTVLPKIIPLLDSLEDIWLSGGEPLVARHLRTLIKTACQKKPEINISFTTNGYYLNKDTLDELCIKNLNLVEISIHAATRETYKKITRTDAFDRIIENLAFISDLKKQGNVNKIILNFVVHSMNYTEMIDFVKLAKKFDVAAFFWPYQPWDSAEMYKHFDEVAVFKPYHKDYPKLKEILHNPIFKSKYCGLNKELEAIANS